MLTLLICIIFVLKILLLLHQHMQSENSTLNIPQNNLPAALHLSSPQETSKKVELFSKPSHMRPSIDSQFSTG